MIAASHEANTVVFYLAVSDPGELVWVVIAGCGGGVNHKGESGQRLLQLLQSPDRHVVSDILLNSGP